MITLTPLLTVVLPEAPVASGHWNGFLAELIASKFDASVNLPTSPLAINCFVTDFAMREIANCVLSSWITLETTYKKAIWICFGSVGLRNLKSHLLTCFIMFFSNLCFSTVNPSYFCTMWLRCVIGFWDGKGGQGSSHLCKTGAWYKPELPFCVISLSFEFIFARFETLPV